MPYTWMPGHQKRKYDTYLKLMLPLNNTLTNLTPLTSGCNRPLQMTFEDQINILVYFHLEEHHSGRHLLQVLKENHFARQYIAPEKGIQKSSFFEDISSRGLEQMVELFEKLYMQAAKQVPKGYAELGDLTIIDGSLIDAVLSMYWADYRDGAKKAKVHIGFDLNRGIPKKIFLTDGKASTTRHEIRKNDVPPGGIVFYDAVVLLGTRYVNQTEKEVRLVGYRVANVDYWIATDRHDLSAEQIAFAYKLRWSIEIFFGWWKRHLKVYHLISRSKYGLMVQMLAGLITYLLLAIFCYNEHQENVSVKRLREICIKIRNETSLSDIVNGTGLWIYQPPGLINPYAIT
jgi:hypothetical protein